jgi:hypothetical protein
VVEAGGVTRPLHNWMWGLCWNQAATILEWWQGALSWKKQLVHPGAWRMQAFQSSIAALLSSFLKGFINCCLMHPSCYWPRKCERFILK